MSHSPSEFLTFYRRVATKPSLLRAHRSLPRPAQPVRAITYSGVRRDIGDKKTHTTRKDNRLDVQSDASHAGREAKGQGKGGHATSQSSSDSVGKAKEEHPAAPDAKIGFQDERGGKGP
ncbi:hypothetical protein ANO11243_001720 [Dothideomycetidae sp. 11243]|nr:hypothetical protein ANO11243_001720 [fungal sp. No.11243]